SLRCVNTVVTACGKAEGCCPRGCNSLNDPDCRPVCGNGVVEAGELCDGNCPTTCNDNNPCTNDRLAGSPTTCNATCTFTPIRNGCATDGCCESGCSYLADADCNARYGGSFHDYVNCGTTCETANPFTGTCGGPANFKSHFVDTIDGGCNTSTHRATIFYRDVNYSAFSDDFLGFFARYDSACGAGCFTINPIGGGCQCTPNAKRIDLRISRFCSTTLVPATLSVCYGYSANLQLRTFGGAYELQDNGACLVANPLAGNACACPAGFRGHLYRTNIVVGTATTGASIYFCHRQTVP
ncbi:MAG: hypothetical protein ACK4N5_26990, partial [Myxococcales bacterium]